MTKFKIMLGNVNIFDSNNNEIKPIRRLEILDLKFNEYSLLMRMNYTILPINSSQNYFLRIFDFKEHMKDMEQCKEDYPNYRWLGHKRNFRGYDKKHLISLDSVFSIWNLKRFSNRILYFEYLKEDQILILCNKKGRFLMKNPYRIDLHSKSKKFHHYIIHKGEINKKEKLQSKVFDTIFIEW